MIRKRRAKFKESSENSESDASVRFDWKPDVTNIENLILETSPLPMAALEGADHILRYVNSAFCRLACKTKDELTGKPFIDVVPWEGCLALLDLVYSTGEVQIQIEPKKNAEAHSARRSYTIWPILGADDHPAGVMMQVADTTQFQQRAIAVNEQLLLSGVRQHELRERAEKLNAQLRLEIADRKRMEQALVTSEKLAVTARFALTMAHEINNPLEAIANLVFLLGPLQTSPEAEAYIATIENQLQGLSRIATQALKFHRDSNKPGVFKLSAVLREVSDFYRPRPRGKELSFINDLRRMGPFQPSEAKSYRSLRTCCSMRLMPRPLADRSSCIYIPLHAGSAKSMLHADIASRSLIAEAVLRRKIERDFISLSSPQKGSEELDSDYGLARVSSTALVVRYVFGAHAGPVVRAHVSRFFCPSSKPSSHRFAAVRRSEGK